MTDVFENAPQWAKDLNAQIEEVKASQARVAAPAPLPEPPAGKEKMVRLGFGEVQADHIPAEMREAHEREARAIGTQFDFVDELEKSQPDKYSNLRQHIADVQAEFRAANDQNRPLTEDEISKRDTARETAKRILGDRLVPVSREDEFFR